MIQDTGKRREFSTGAVRDIDVSKGRCDLMPLDQIGIHLQLTYQEKGEQYNEFLNHISTYIYQGCTASLFCAIDVFAAIKEQSLLAIILDTAVHYDEGARKYVERNWEKGIPLHSYIDSAVRHFFKFVAGYNDERHDRAIVWNLYNAAWTHEHLPDMIDLPFAQVSSKFDTGNNTVDATSDSMM